VARALYSERLASGSLAPGLHSLVGPDRSHIWVLRDLDAYANTSALDRVDLLLRGDSGQGIAYLEWKPGTQASRQWTGRQVIPPDGPCSILVGGTQSVDFALSGYVLTFP
jgi:hypothetical protein